MYRSLNQDCDDEFHVPKKMQTHRRVPLADRALAEAARKQENYANSSKLAGSEKIVKYTFEDDDGYYYVYKNNSVDLTLVETIRINACTNAELDSKGLEGATAVKLILTPGSAENIHFKKPEAGKACHVAISQFFSIHQGGEGETSSLEKYDGGDLKALTEEKGEQEDYTEIDAVAGGVMHKWSYKHMDGYCFLYKNKSKKMQLSETIDFELTNLRVDGDAAEEGKEGDTITKVKVILEPGQEKFITLSTIDSGDGFSLAVSSMARIKKSRKVW
jgi:hypothetical protein